MTQVLRLATLALIAGTSGLAWAESSKLELVVSAGGDAPDWTITVKRGERILDRCVTRDGRCELSLTERTGLTVWGAAHSEFVAQVPLAGERLELSVTRSHWRWGWLLAGAGAAASVGVGVGASACTSAHCSNTLLGVLAALIAGELVGGGYAVVAALREHASARVVSP